VIVRIRTTPAGFDDYGDPIATATEYELTLTGCFTAPAGVEEVLDRGRHGSIVFLDLYGPTGTDIRHDDIIEIGARRYEVEGEPETYQSPHTGWNAGMKVRLRSVEG
jgi:hypothetical protein